MSEFNLTDALRRVTDDIAKEQVPKSNGQQASDLSQILSNAIGQAFETYAQTLEQDATALQQKATEAGDLLIKAVQAEVAKVNACIADYVQESIQKAARIRETGKAEAERNLAQTSKLAEAAKRQDEIGQLLGIVSQ